ncbi:hypothetical protein [Vibrio owensii]|uniref:hypothetical protein n=1 Tax=Vibrio harveyi group TaxID=717610 RepID=UPI003CC5BB2B
MTNPTQNQEPLKEPDVLKMHQQNVELERKLSNDIVMLQTLLNTEEEKLETLKQEALEKFGVSTVDELRALYTQNLNKNRETVVPTNQKLIEIEQIVSNVKKELNLG